MPSTWPIKRRCCNNPVKQVCLWRYVWICWNMMIMIYWLVVHQPVYIYTTKVWVGLKMEDHHLTIPTLVEVWAAHNCNWAEDGSIQNHWKIRKTHFWTSIRKPFDKSDGVNLFVYWKPFEHQKKHQNTESAWIYGSLSEGQQDMTSPGGLCTFATMKRAEQ